MTAGKPQNLINRERRAVTYRLPNWILGRVEQEAQKTGTTATRVIELCVEQYLADRCGTCGQAVIPDE